VAGVESKDVAERIEVDEMEEEDFL